MREALTEALQDYEALSWVRNTATLRATTAPCGSCPTAGRLFDGDLDDYRAGAVPKSASARPKLAAGIFSPS